MSSAHSAPGEPRPIPVRRVIAFGLGVGMLASFSLMAAVALRASADARLPVVSITALFLLCIRPAFDSLAAWAGVARAAVVGALSILPIAPLLFVGALFAMTVPILSSHSRSEGAATAVAIFTPVAFLWVSCLGASFMAATVGDDRAWIDALIRGARRGALVLGSFLFAAAVVRGLRKPDPERYLALLPEIGVIPAASGDPIAILPPKGNGSLDETWVYDDRFANLVVRRACVSGSCRLSLRSVGSVAAPDAPQASSAVVSGRNPLSVRRDEKHDLWVLGEQMAFGGWDLQRLDIDVSTVADGLSPPLGWTLGAGIGLLIAGLSTVQRTRVARCAAAEPGVADAARIRSRLAELDSFALSAQLVTAAPLGAALFRGLVF
jgi:hypothetical protein